MMDVREGGHRRSFLRVGVARSGGHLTPAPLGGPSTQPSGVREFASGSPARFGRQVRPQGCG
ncbi:hypothetical protein ACFPRL_09280 [Pseudoclavibacter helvolus]